MVEQVQEKTKYKRFEPQKRLLLGPGPSPVDPRVTEAMSAPVLGHLDPQFQSCMDDIKVLLRHAFQTANRMTFPISGTGSAGMQAAVTNLLEPGDEAVVCVCGFFGERMLDMVERSGAQATVVRADWGKAIDRDQIEQALKSSKAKVLAIVHAETSTGVQNEITGLGQLAHKHGSLVIVDCVTSLATSEIAVDRNELDVCFSCTQKGLGAPPGLSPITFSDRALAAIHARRSRITSWYLDVTTIEKYWGADRAYHHTAPISMNYALREALRLLHEEGLEPRWARHKLNNKAFIAGLEAMGLNATVEPAHRMPSLTVLALPQGIDEAKGRGRLLEKHGIEIGAGLGAFKGKVWRIGLMGVGSTRENVLLLLGALAETLEAQGHKCPSGIQAAEAVYSTAK